MTGGENKVSPVAVRLRGLPAAIWFGGAVLRGIGQVMFQNNPLTGALFLLAILIDSLIAGPTIASQGSNATMLFVGAILGTVVSTATAMLLGVDHDLVGAGLYGFNGTLVGIAFPFFVKTNVLLVAYIIVGAAVSTVIMAALMNFLGHWDVPVLTAPFVFTTWIFLFALWAFSALQGTKFLPAPGLPHALVISIPPSLGTLWPGLLEGVGEVMFQVHWIAGLIFLIGILVNSRISFVFALVGSLVGLIVGVVLGGDPSMLSAGLYGFNSVLVGIALGGFFYVLDWKSALYTIFGAAAGAIAMGAIVSALTPLGMPALTSPFVLVTWLFIFAKALFTQLRPVPPSEATTPEGNRRAATR
jgi:urea transporter